MMEYLDVNYMLEIYPPNNNLDPVALLQAKAPFGSISIGDLINPRDLSQEYFGKLLRVINIEHFIWQIEDSHIGHKIMVFTEAVDDTEETRLGPTSDVNEERTGGSRGGPRLVRT